MRRLAGVAALALSTFAFTAVAHAAVSGVGSSPLDTGHCPIAPLPAELHAGDVVELRWDALPAEFEEMELVLSVDGREFDLRISPEMDPRTRRFRWRVPNLSAAAARIAIRGGGPRDPHGPAGETWFPASATFRVVADPRAPRAVIALREGASWDPADIDLGGGPVASMRGAPRTELRAGAAVFSAVSPPRGPHCDAPAAVVQDDRPSTTPETSAAVALSWRAPRRAPLRN